MTPKEIITEALRERQRAGDFNGNHLTTTLLIDFAPLLTEAILAALAADGIVFARRACGVAGCDGHLSPLSEETP